MYSPEMTHSLANNSEDDLDGVDTICALTRAHQPWQEAPTSTEYWLDGFVSPSGPYQAHYPQQIMWSTTITGGDSMHREISDSTYGWPSNYTYGQSDITVAQERRHHAWMPNSALSENVTNPTLPAHYIPENGVPAQYAHQQPYQSHMQVSSHTAQHQHDDRTLPTSSQSLRQQYSSEPESSETWEYVNHESSPSTLSEQADGFAIIHPSRSGLLLDHSPDLASDNTTSNRLTAKAVESTILRDGTNSFVEYTNSGVKTRSLSPDLENQRQVVANKSLMPLLGDQRYRHQDGRTGSLVKPRRAKAANTNKKRHLSLQGRSNAATRRQKNDRCLRCRVYKIRCATDETDPLGRCQPCLKVLTSARSFLEPCNRTDLKTIKLVRHSNGRFNQEQVAFRQYSWRYPPDTRSCHVNIRWSFPNSQPITNMKFLNTPCREYQPTAEDGLDTTTYEVNFNGEVRPFQFAALALCDETRLQSVIAEFLHQTQSEVELWLRDQLLNPLHRATFVEAQRYRNAYNSTVLRLVFQMACGAVLSQGYGTIIEKEDEGFNVPPEERSAYEAYNSFNHKSRVPQAIGHQFDVAILKHINNLQSDMLKELQKKVLSSEKNKSWFEIYLACSVLLLNLEYIFDGANRYIESKRKTTIQSQVNRVVVNQTDEWRHSAEILLQHFRVILRGQLPFELARTNMSKLKQQACLDDAAVCYLQSAITMLDAPAIRPDRVTTTGHLQFGSQSGWVDQLFNVQNPPQILVY